jgi:hypothetical protein
MSPVPDHRAPLHRLDWAGWEVLILENGITLDRPRGSAHPVFPEIVYPIDYGFVNGTISSDGQEVDVFVGTAAAGSAAHGLVGAVFTTDYRRGDRECKLLWNCSPGEIYLVNGFLNFDRALMEGTLVLRRPMRELWSDLLDQGA